VTFIWHGRVFDFGLFQINPGVRSNHAIFGPTEDIPGYLSYALFALAGLHAVGSAVAPLFPHDTVHSGCGPAPLETPIALILSARVCLVPSGIGGKRGDV